jgi:hypothetical protein
MTMTDLDALDTDTPERNSQDEWLDESEHGPECACGCGEYLPVGSTRAYKRGHKDGSHTRRTENSPARPLLKNLDEAALLTPDDPRPADEDDKPLKPQPIRITKKLQADIEAKLMMMFGFMSVGISAKDPVCGGALSDNIDKIVPKMVPIICKSPELVKWFTKGSGYMVWFDLAMVCWPVIQVAIAHHLTHSIGQPSQNGHGPNPTQTVSFDQYTA